MLGVDVQKEQKFQDQNLLHKYFVLKVSTEAVKKFSWSKQSKLHFPLVSESQHTHTQFHSENNLNFFPKQYPLFVLPVYRLQCPSHMG